MINEIEKAEKATESSEPTAFSTETSNSEQGGSVTLAGNGVTPNRAKKKKKSSALAAAAMGRSAVSAVTPSASLDIDGRSDLLNSGPDISYNE
jgi:hypothetical protein